MRDSRLGTVMLYDPTAPLPGATPGSARKLEGLAGKVVGFIDNAKPNFNYLVEDLAELLKKQLGVKDVIIRRKRAASIPALKSYIDELAGCCDVVITGSGD